MINKERYYIPIFSNNYTYVSIIMCMLRKAPSHKGFFCMHILALYQLKTRQRYKLKSIYTNILTLLTYKLFLNFFPKKLAQFKYFVYLCIVKLKQINNITLWR